MDQAVNARLAVGLQNLVVEDRDPRIVVRHPPSVPRPGIAGRIRIAATGEFIHSRTETRDDASFSDVMIGPLVGRV